MATKTIREAIRILILALAWRLTRRGECGCLHRHIAIEASPSRLLSRENVLKYVVPEIERLLKP